ncbi:MAG: DoxX family membrane protein [Pseudomonadota bacterium]
MDIRRLSESFTRPLNAASGPILTTSARLIFAGVLLVYFWQAGLTKLGEGAFGFLNPAMGAYIQIFPRAVEAAGFDISQLGLWHDMVVIAGTWAEFVLPLLVVLGLLTRLSALGMMGFIIVQSATDLYGHGGLENGTFGAWFDRASDALIADQRAFWLLALAILVLKGGGPLSLDRVILARARTGAPTAPRVAAE